MFRNRLEVSAQVEGTKGVVLRKRGIASVLRNDPGMYTIRFPADRPVRPEHHHFSVTIMNTTEFRTAQIAQADGASVLVRINDMIGDPVDADFQFAAERI
jgi:hypothetical protein